MNKKLLNKVLNILSINEYDIIGSKADKNIQDIVISDIDTQDIEEDSDINYDDILKHFQNVYTILKNNPNIIITDFKSGYNQLTNRPYRWTYKTIKKGYQYDEENNKVYFIDTLKIKSIIKIDVIIYTSIRNDTNEYIELTMNYYFKNQYLNTYNKKSKKDIINELKNDIKELKEDGNYYKALKRLNSLYKIQSKKPPKKLIEIINSKYGLMAKDKSKLETLLYLINIKNTNKHINEIKKEYQVKTKEDIIKKIDELNYNINNSYLKDFLNNLI